MISLFLFYFFLHFSGDVSRSPCNNHFPFSILREFDPGYIEEFGSSPPPLSSTSPPPHQRKTTRRSRPCSTGGVPLRIKNRYTTLKRSPTPDERSQAACAQLRNESSRLLNKNKSPFYAEILFDLYVRCAGVVGEAGLAPVRQVMTPLR